MALTINLVDQSDKTLRLSIQGSLDSETSPELEQKLDGLITSHTELVAINLAELDFISSAGLRVFFKTIKKVKANGGRLAVSHMKPGVKKVFEIVKAMPDLSVFASTEELDAYLASFQNRNE